MREWIKLLKRLLCWLHATTYLPTYYAAQYRNVTSLPISTTTAYPIVGAVAAQTRIILEKYKCQDEKSKKAARR